MTNLNDDGNSIDLLIEIQEALKRYIDKYGDNILYQYPITCDTCLEFCGYVRTIDNSNIMIICSKCMDKKRIIPSDYITQALDYLNKASQ